MKRNKSLLFIVLIFILSIVLIAFSGCSKKETEGIRYNDVVEGRYSDGMRIIDTYAAPAFATEFIDKDRVEKIMYVDNRVKGLHFTGLYLPKGETITVTIGTTIISQQHKLIINSDQDDEVIIDLNSSSVTYTADKGSRIDLWVDSSVAEYHAFEITLNGCVEMPYYRLGVDKHKIKATDGFAVLDCANARFIIPANMISVLTNIDDTLRWWRSSIEIMNRITEAGLQSGDLAPINIYVSNEYNVNTWTVSDKYIRIREDDFINMMDYDKLANGSGEVLLKLLGGLIAKRSDGYDVGVLKDEFGDVISDIVYIIMTDNIKSDVEVNKANAGEYLTSILNKKCEDKPSQIFYNVILHSFGINKTIDIIKAYKFSMQQKMNTGSEQYFVDVSNILEKDISDFCEFLGFEVSQTAKDEVNNLPKFIPVQTMFTTGGVENAYQTGIVLPLGQKSTLNFNEAIVSLKDGWVVEQLNGSNSWTKVEDGIYDYNPNKERLEDNFTVLLRNGEDTMTLYGHISVNIKVASYKVFNNTSYKDLDEAIKELKKVEPSNAFSVNKAQVIQENEDNENVYSFAMTSGSMQVKEDGKYTFYLKSKGLVKVKFGVSEYMFDMMSNQLTVTDYTEELKYEVDLESSKVYNFEIYVLSTQGGGWATLGIKDDNGNIVDLDENYIVFQDMNRSSIVNYEAPVIDIDNFRIQEKDYQHHLTRNWKLINKFELNNDSKEEYLFDNNKTTYFEVKDPSKEFVLVLDMTQKFKAEYILISNKVNMVGTDVIIEWSTDNVEYNFLYKGKINSTDNLIIFENKDLNCQYIRIKFNNDADFKCELSEIALGRIMKESIIIPNTSTKISYQGEWHEINNYASVNGSITVNNDKNSTIAYEFYGNMISVYSTKDKDFGMMKVYIDNKEVAVVNLYDTSAKCQEKVFSKEFEETGLHTIKLVPQGKGDIINIDYLTSVETDRPVAEKNKFNYWYITIIPGVIILALIGFAIADGINKKNKNSKK